MNDYKKIVCSSAVADYSSIIKDVFDRVEDGDTVEFEKGVYPIGDTNSYKTYIGLSNNDYGERKIAVYVRDKKDITIKGNGATLFLTAEIGAFGFVNCRNVVLSGFCIDYEKNCHLEFKIDAINGTEIRLKKREGFDFEMSNALYVRGRKLSSALSMEFDEQRKRPYANRSYYFLNFGDEQMPPYYTAARLEEKDGAHILRSEIAPKLHEGGVLVVCYRKTRDVQCCFFDGCSGVAMSDMEIAYSPSMGIIAQMTENIAIRNVNVRPNGRHGLVSAVCDASHFVHCDGFLKINDCNFYNMMDDGVNVHGNYATVHSVQGDTVLLHIRHKQQEYVNTYKKGDVLKIYEGKSVNVVASPEVVYSELTAPNTVKLVCKGDISAVKEGDTVCNYDRMPEVEISGVSVGNNRPRGLLLHSSKKTVVKDCVFSDCEHGIELAGDTDYWFESGGCTDVTIRNCVFDDCNYSAGDFAIMVRPVYQATPQAPFYHGSVAIVDNIFYGKAGMVFAKGVQKLTVTGNRRKKSRCYEYPEKSTSVKIKTENCGFGQIRDNEDESELMNNLRPFWTGDEIYEECFTLVGKSDTPTFLYAPKTDAPISVVDYNKTTEFAYGVDYKIEDGKFVPCGDRLPHFEYDEFYRTEPDRIAVGVNPEKISFPDGKRRYFKFGELHKKTLRISYRCDKSRGGVFRPYAESGCPAFLEKLKRGEDAKILFYGDSITEGADASAEARTAPFADMWGIQACEFLKTAYKNERLRYINTAVGGKDSLWGRDNVRENVNAYAPDLVVLAFGMNDGGKTTEEFKILNEQMIHAIKSAKKETEIILVGTSVPNPESTWFGNQYKFVEVYEELAKKYACSVLDMTRLTLRLYGENGAIRYRDFSGNNVNHPNDFGVRIYAQSFLSRVLGKEYEEFFEKLK